MAWVTTNLGKTLGLVYPPGEIPMWSAINPVLEGALIERASGQYYAQYMRDHVFAPLGMNRTVFGGAVIEDGDYAVSFATYPQYAYLRPWTTWSSVLDVAKLLEFFLNGNDAVLRKELREAMMAGQQESLGNPSHVHAGYGTMLSADGYAAQKFYPYNFKTVGNGSDGWSYSMSYRMVPSRGFGMVLLSNSKGFTYADELYIKAFELILGEPPVAAATDQEPAAALAKYVGEYVTINPAGPIVVTSTDGGLHLTWWSGKKGCDLVQGNPGNFTCPGADITGDGVWFIGDSDEAATHACSWSFVGHRVPDWDAGVDADASSE
jgi:CubicO group peptidase (beta-lactamase class C family)